MPEQRQRIARSPAQLTPHSSGGGGACLGGGVQQRQGGIVWDAQEAEAEAMHVQGGHERAHEEALQAGLNPVINQWVDGSMVERQKETRDCSCSGGHDRG